MAELSACGDETFDDSSVCEAIGRDFDGRFGFEGLVGFVGFVGVVDFVGFVEVAIVGLLTFGLTVAGKAAVNNTAINILIILTIVLSLFSFRYFNRFPIFYIICRITILIIPRSDIGIAQ